MTQLHKPDPRINTKLLTKRLLKATSYTLQELADRLMVTHWVVVECLRNRMSLKTLRAITKMFGLTEYEIRVLQQDHLCLDSQHLTPVARVIVEQYKMEVYLAHIKE